MNTLAAWHKGRAEGQRARDIATSLGLSEAELVASACGAELSADPTSVRSTRLAFDPTSLLPALSALGPLKGITRNDMAVLEVEGDYTNFEFFKAHSMGQAVGTIDLRIFLKHWVHGFFVEEQSRRGERISLQFFDAFGVAVHKIYATSSTEREALRRLVQEHHHSDTSSAQQVEPMPVRADEKPDAEVDVEGFRRDYRAMQDTHSFFGLLMRYGLNRRQALRLIGEEFAQRLDHDVLDALLRGAASEQVPLMLFVGNRGMVQINTSVPRKVVAMDAWWNVLDPGFNLHVQRDRVHDVWLVRKPTADGLVTSIELFDASAESTLFVFGQRKPGQVEDERWRTLANGLPRA